MVELMFGKWRLFRFRNVQSEFLGLFTFRIAFGNIEQTHEGVLGEPGQNARFWAWKMLIFSMGMETMNIEVVRRLENGTHHPLMQNQ